MNVLLINLTRFGDLLQMQPVILGLKAQGHRVGLLCLDNFAWATALLQGVDHVAALPGSTLLSGLDKDWHLALHVVDTVLADVQKRFPVDRVINTTATLSARLLARRLSTSAVGRPPVENQAQGTCLNEEEHFILGFGLDHEGFGVSGDMWATFLQGASAERLNCPFNIVDMFRAAAKVGSGPSHKGLRRPEDPIVEKAERMLKACAPEGYKGFVTFQLGASESRRQWPVEYFAKLGALLWQELKLCPVLLGSPAEKALATAYAKATTSGNKAPFVDMVGATDVPHLAGLLLHSRLLVSNDTGTMHLAAGLHVPVLGIFLATAQPWDTGPYMPGCCCLEPAMPCHPCPFHQPCTPQWDSNESACSKEEGKIDTSQPCLRRISASTVFALCRHFLHHGQWARLEQHEARIWLTSEDSSGFADLQGLSGHENEERSLWLRQQRYFYRQILDGKESTLGQEMPTSLGLSPEFKDKVKTHLRQTEELLLLLEEQTHLVQHMPSQKNGERLIATCNRIRLVLEQCQGLKALAHLWLVLSQERGGQLSTFLGMATDLREHMAAWRKALQ